MSVNKINAYECGDGAIFVSEDDAVKHERETTFKDYCNGFFTDDPLGSAFDYEQFIEEVFSEFDIIKK